MGDETDGRQPAKRPAEIDTLDVLFNKAKANDEFEYACALLRISGAQDAGWDPLEESERAIADYIALIEAPLRGDTRLRLALLVYSHILEIDAVYEVIENMLSITEGKRCSVSPLAHLYEKRRRKFLQPARPPSAKKVVNYLEEHAERNGELQLAKVLEEMFNEEIRNAFFHSDYVIFKDEFRIRHGWAKSMKFSELEKVINKAIHFFQSFMIVWREHRLSYKAHKIVQGRVGPGGEIVDVELLVHPVGGLYGFRTPPGDEPPAG